MHAAALDEVTHAELCFTLASGYAGVPCDPGRLSAGQGELALLTMPQLGVNAFERGCVGDALVAAVAEAGLGASTDAAVRHALAAMVSAGRRQVETAWAIVEFALQQGGQEVHAALTAAASEAKTVASAAPTQPNSAAAAHGVVAVAERERIAQAVRQQASEDLHALLQQAST